MAQAFPHGKWILYQQDFGGHEYYDIFAVPSGGGAPVNLTNTPEIETDPDLLAQRKDAGPQLQTEDSFQHRHRDHGLELAPAEEAHQRASNDHEWSLVDWSPDGRFVYANRIFVGFTDASVFRINVENGKQELTPHQGQVVIAASTGHGKTRPSRRTRRAATTMSPCSTSRPKRSPGSPIHSGARAAATSPRRQEAHVRHQRRRHHHAYLYDIASRKSTTVQMPPGLTSPVGNPNAFSPDGKSLLLSHQDTQRPPTSGSTTSPQASRAS